MTKNIVGDSIIKFRKAAGLTQEELGRAVGVSTQAVSKWECGGMPDAALFPTLADALGVGIDALFGREPGQTLDLLRIIEGEIRRTPENRRMEKVYELAWSMMQQVICNNRLSGSAVADMIYSIHRIDRSAVDDETLPAHVIKLAENSGIMEASIAQDYQYFFLMPEPEKGYASILKNEEEYLRLFQLLLKEHRFHLLVMAYSGKLKAFSADYIAKEVGLPRDAVAEALEDLRNHNFLDADDVAMAEGVIKVYRTKDGDDLIPFLYFATQFMYDKGKGKLLAIFREKPILSGRLGEGNCVPEWRTGEKRKTVDYVL